MSTVTIGVDLAESLSSVCELDDFGHVMQRRCTTRTVWLVAFPAFRHHDGATIGDAHAFKHGRKIWAMLAYEVDYDSCACLNHPMHQQTYAAHAV